jgi:transposase
MPYSIEIGIDLHKEFSMFAAIDGNGTLLSLDKISNDTRIFDSYLEKLPSKNIRATVESTRGVNWVIDYFDIKKIPLIVSNPFLNRAIANIHCKNDKYDAQILAHLTRANLIAECYIPSKPIRDLRDLLAHRAKLVQISTKLKNKVHNVLSKYNYLQPYAEMFGPRGRTWLDQQKFTSVHTQILEETLELLTQFKPRILQLDKTVKEKVHRHPYYRNLQTIPGIGPLNAAVIIARVEDIGRFKKVESFIRYAGLSINTRASGDKLYLGKINRKSDKYLRTAFVDAAIVAIQKDPGLCQFNEYLKSHKGKGIARVAVARKLARSTYFVLLKQKPYRYRQLQRQWFQAS